MELFPNNHCQLCGKPGAHPDCEARVQLVEADFAATDLLMLRKHARYHSYGAKGSESLESITRAVNRLSEFLGRPPDFDPDGVIEGGAWWFIPDGWIGIIGFIVEKSTSRVFLLGSGLASVRDRPNCYAHWCAIEEYVEGNVEPTV